MKIEILHQINLSLPSNHSLIIIAAPLLLRTLLLLHHVCRIQRVRAHGVPLVLCQHDLVGGKLLADCLVYETPTYRLERHLLILRPQTAIDRRGLPHEHPHLLECGRPEPPGLTLVHHGIVHIIRLHYIKVIPPLKRRLLLLQVPIRRMRPPQLAS